MKKFWLVMAAVVAAGCCAGVSAAEAKRRHPTLLFVQSAVSGTFNGGELAIKDESPLVLYFSDRPNRMAGHMTSKRFLKLWTDGADSFKKDPPNAVVSILSDKDVTNAVVELSSPVLAGGKWTYKAKLISGTLPKTFGAASVFIDSYTAPEQEPKVLGDAPAMAMGNLYVTMASSLRNFMMAALGHSGSNEEKSGLATLFW